MVFVSSVKHDGGRAISDMSFQSPQVGIPIVVWPVSTWDHPPSNPQHAVAITCCARAFKAMVLCLLELTPITMEARRSWTKPVWGQGENLPKGKEPAVPY